jgi:UDP-N-acetylenolpyruvoylglucosamine reductase
MAGAGRRPWRRQARAGSASTLTAVAEPPPIVQRDYPLARLTTIRTGGAAEYFARPSTVAQLSALLQWAAGAQLQVGVVGSGSNLLVADEGVPGLVIKLDGELSRIAVDGSAIDCGGGARLPSVAARAAHAGLAGLEFGVNIPGTVGGAVRMNANAYGGALADVLEFVEVVSAAGVQRRKPAELGFSYRRSDLAGGEVVSAARFSLRPAPPERVRELLADLRARRRAAQPSGIKTFGSTFKNPTDERAGGRTAGQLLDEAGCRGLRIGGAGFSVKHANFVENHGEATTAEVVAVMAEGARRVRERFGVELEPEVQALGPVRLPQEWSR